MRRQSLIQHLSPPPLRRESNKKPAIASQSQDDWPKILEWAEKQTSESMKSRVATAEAIAKESQATLTVLLAGLGGSAVYAAKFFDPGPSSPPIWGFAIVCGYLSALSILLIMRSMRFKSYPAQYQTPKNLLQRNFSLDELREAELENLTQRIEEAAGINNGRAAALNQVRIAAALSPLIFLIAALLTMCVT